MDVVLQSIAVKASDMTITFSGESGFLLFILIGAFSIYGQYKILQKFGLFMNKGFANKRIKRAYKKGLDKMEGERNE